MIHRDIWDFIFGISKMFIGYAVILSILILPVFLIAWIVEHIVETIRAIFGIF